MEKILDNEIDLFIKELVKEKKVSFWGVDYMITPALVSEIHGDGLQIVGVESMATRPNYYILRIDSSVDITSDDFDEDEILLQPIEEEFGNIDEWKEIQKNGKTIYINNLDDTYRKTEKEVSFPMLNWYGGKWWTIERLCK